MEKLKQKILEKQRVVSDGILNVTDFVNHQIDVSLMREAAREFLGLFAGKGITKIMTAEGAGVAIAAMTAEELGVPMLFAKKMKKGTAGDSAYHVQVTDAGEYELGVMKEYLSEDDAVLLLDDCLANGDTIEALWQLAKEAGACVVGAGIMIEKAFQDGGKRLRENGLLVESLVRISAMSREQGVSFC